MKIPYIFDQNLKFFFARASGARNSASVTFCRGCAKKSTLRERVRLLRFLFSHSFRVFRDKRSTLGSSSPKVVVCEQVQMHMACKHDHAFIVYARRVSSASSVCVRLIYGYVCVCFIPECGVYIRVLTGGVTGT